MFFISKIQEFFFLYSQKQIFKNRKQKLLPNITLRFFFFIQKVNITLPLQAKAKVINLLCCQLQSWKLRAFLLRLTPIFARGLFLIQVTPHPHPHPPSSPPHPNHGGANLEFLRCITNFLFYLTFLSLGCLEQPI